MSDIQLAEGTIKNVGGKWYLYFSDGRKEGPFGSQEAAKKRERQIQFFKHRSKASLETMAEYQEMADLDIAAEYRLNDLDEVIYLIVQDGDIVPILTKGEENSREIIELDKDAHKEYEPILDFIFGQEEMEDEGRKFNLSPAVVDGQLITTGHKHTCTLDEHRDGKSTHDSGHEHMIFNGFVGSAPVEINGIMIVHTHLLEVTPSKE